MAYKPALQIPYRLFTPRARSISSCRLTSSLRHKFKSSSVSPCHNLDLFSDQNLLVCSRWERMLSNKTKSMFDTRNGNLPKTKILYDGDCKICQVEINLLKEYTRNRTNLIFVDISSLDYESSKYGGVSYEDAMKEMHVIGSDGKVYTQGDAIRHMYRACGLGLIADITQVPVIKPVCDWLYMVFARYRLQKALDRCDTGACSVKLRQLREKIDEESNK